MAELAIIGTGSTSMHVLDVMLTRRAASSFLVIDPSNADSPSIPPPWIATRQGAANQIGNVSIRFETDTREACSSDIVIYATGDATTQGSSGVSQIAQDRAGLLRDRAPALRQFIRALGDSLRDIVFIVVDDPIDALTAVACSAAIAQLGVEKADDFDVCRRILGVGTIAPTRQFRHLLARRMDVHVDDVAAVVFGQRGKVEIPGWSSATVAQTPLHLYQPRGKRPINVRDRVSIFEEVRTQALELDEVGGTTAFAEALAAADLVECILQNAHRVMTPSVRQRENFTHDGETDQTCCIARPSIIGRNGVVRVVEEFPLNANEEAALAEAARSVRQLLETLDSDQ